MDNAQGSTRHSSETREEWNRAVSKIGRDFLIKEACSQHPQPHLLTGCRDLLLLNSHTTAFEPKMVKQTTLAPQPVLCIQM